MAFRIASSHHSAIRRLAMGQRQTFSTSASRFIKEDAERSPEHIEQKKQQSVNKAERGDGQWHEELASSGESNVKADRQEVQDHDEHIEELQKDTAKKGEKGDL